METTTLILHNPHRDASACRVAELAIEDLALENSALRERVTSLEGEHDLYQVLIRRLIEAYLFREHEQRRRIATIEKRLGWRAA
jgi:hypothetical protein